MIAGDPDERDNVVLRRWVLSGMAEGVVVAGAILAWFGLPLRGLTFPIALLLFGTIFVFWLNRRRDPGLPILEWQAPCTLTNQWASHLQSVRRGRGDGDVQPPTFTGRFIYQ
jgi:hypothetical protein